MIYFLHNIFLPWVIVCSVLVFFWIIEWTWETLTTWHIPTNVSIFHPFTGVGGWCLTNIVKPSWTVEFQICCGSQNLRGWMPHVLGSPGGGWVDHVCWWSGFDKLTLTFDSFCMEIGYVSKIINLCSLLLWSLCSIITVWLCNLFTGLIV